jgi:hypothetical protein
VLNIAEYRDGHKTYQNLSLSLSQHDTNTSTLRIMQQTMFLTLACIGWITCATSLPDGLISESFAENENQLRGFSGLTTVLASLSGYLTTSYYDDRNCKTLKYAEGVKLGACEYLSSSYPKFRITTADQNAITVTNYYDKDCSTVYWYSQSTAYTDGACTTSMSYRVSATRNVSTPGYMKRSINTT